jgi:hypothetical protein
MKIVYSELLNPNVNMCRTLLFFSPLHASPAYVHGPKKSFTAEQARQARQSDKHSFVNTI